MKKLRAKFMSWCLIVVLLIMQILPIGVFATYPAPELGAQDAVAKFQSGIPMGVAHRAAWRNGPECSLISIAAAIEMGIDVVEIDVQLTSDGVVVLLHDDTIDRTTLSTGNVVDYTWAQLSSISVEPGQGGIDQAYTLTAEDAALLNLLPNYTEHSGQISVGSAVPLTRLDDAIDLIKQIGPRTMINLDKCFTQDKFVACYILFRETDMLEHVFFKNEYTASEMEGWYTAAATAWNAKYPNSPVTAQDVRNGILYVNVFKGETPAVLQGHLDAGNNLVMAEICIANDAADDVMRTVIEPWCIENDIAMFINTMWSGQCSTKEDSETTWAEMIDRGYTAIQTDQASELALYLNDYNGTYTASEKIEAEHFHSFNYDDDYGLYVPENCDSSLNKVVQGTGHGDFLEYRNILFDGTEEAVNIFMQGTDDGVITIYLDELAAENQIAQVNVGVTTESQTATAFLESAVAEGYHTIYISSYGYEGSDIANIDYFQFVEVGDDFADAEFSSISAETVVGAKPKLPATVTVLNNGQEFGFGIEWELIDENDYSQTGTFEVLGYVSYLKTFIKAAVTVIPAPENEVPIEANVPTDGLAVWFDAATGINKSGNSVTSWDAKYASLGCISASVCSGEPNVVSNAAAGKAGIYFDGNDAFSFSLPTDFWNTSDEAEYTVFMYVSSEFDSNAAVTRANSQYNSVMYFPQSAGWGSTLFCASSNEISWRFGSGSSGDYGTTIVRDVYNADVFSATAIRKAGNEDSVFVGSSKVYFGESESAATKNTDSAGYIGCGKNNTFFSGTICEILIYNTALADEEVLGVQKYLDDKYNDEIVSIASPNVNTFVGIAPELPQTLSVVYQSGNTGNVGVKWERVNPTYYLEAGTFNVQGVLSNGETITSTVTVADGVSNDGLMLWLSAENGITMAEATVSKSVLSWESRVGNYTANALAGTATLVTESDGTSSIAFDGDDSLSVELAGNGLNGLEEATVIVYAKTTQDFSEISLNTNDDRRTQFHCALSAFESGSWGGFYVGIYEDAVAGRFGTGVSPDTGFYTYRDTDTNAYTTTMIRWNGSDCTYDVDVDGSNFATGVSLAGETANISNTLWLGRGRTANNTDSYWNGSLSEVFIFDRAISDSEINTVYSYLDSVYVETGAENGDVELLISTLETNPNLMMWFSADYGVSYSSAGVESWDSKVGTYSAEALAGNVSVITEANGIKEIKFDGDDSLAIDLDSGALNGMNEATVVVYAKTAQNFASITKNTNDNRKVQYHSVLAANESGSWGGLYVGVYEDAIAARFGTGTSEDTGVYAYRSAETNDYTVTAIRWSGDNMSYDVDCHGGSFSTGNSLGSETKNISDRIWIGRGRGDCYWEGSIREILVYDRVLEDEELAEIYEYLNDAYNESLPDEIISQSPITDVYLAEDDQQISMNVGETLDLDAYTVPANVPNNTLSYLSSNTNVLTVDENGVITALAYGFASVSATSADGTYKAVCYIFVSEENDTRLYQMIQNMSEWASIQNGSQYNNWSDFSVALSTACQVSADDSLGELQAAWNSVKTEFLELSPYPIVN